MKGDINFLSLISYKFSTFLKSSFVMIFNIISNTKAKTNNLNISTKIYLNELIKLDRVLKLLKNKYSTLFIII